MVFLTWKMYKKASFFGENTGDKPAEKWYYDYGFITKN